MPQRGSGAETLAFDATDHDGGAGGGGCLRGGGKPIDILVNNAGMQHRAPLEEFPAEAFERLLQTNIASVFHVGQAVARHMIARGRGKIINIASVQTALARPSIAPYTATKGAVGNLTKGMATDWAKHGLNCNAIAPGYFDTPLNAALVADPDLFGMAGKAHACRALGQGGGVAGGLHLPCVGCGEFRERAYPLCGWGHHGLAMTHRIVIMGVSGCGKSTGGGGVGGGLGHPLSGWG
jgi:NAD(P)-dependent dehydrogenase (short-subunit alcohol dehydrogenase family)